MRKQGQRVDKLEQATGTEPDRVICFVWKEPTPEARARIDAYSREHAGHGVMFFWVDGDNVCCPPL